LYHLGLMTLDNGKLERAKAYINQITNIWGGDLSLIMKTQYLTLTSRLHYLQGDIVSYKHELKVSTQLIKSTSTPWNQKFFLMENLDPFYIIKPRQTVSILGAIHTSEKDPKILPATPMHRRWYEHAEAHARNALGDEAFESAFAEGQKLSLEEALDLVLTSLEETDE